MEEFLQQGQSQSIAQTARLFQPLGQQPGFLARETLAEAMVLTTPEFTLEPLDPFPQASRLPAEAPDQAFGRSQTRRMNGKTFAHAAPRPNQWPAM
jgi:hypothetical protein